MSYKIILDSCGELPEELQADERFERVPLTLSVGDYEILDDDSFDQKDFLKRVSECEECPHSACPSPERFKQAIEGIAEKVYLITLSGKLSGSYNSACIGKELALEEWPDKKIEVIDSQSASIGLTQLAMQIVKREELGLGFEEIVNEVTAIRDKMKTYFVLDNLEILRKNGRLTGVKALVAGALNIKPVMSAIEGSIIQLGQGIGTRKALSKMVDSMVEEMKDKTVKSVMISHCNCLKRAEQVKNMVLDVLPNVEIKILDTKGVSSLYAADGGIILTALV